MENAAEALKMAFAVFVFVIAITVTFMLVGQAKSTSDLVLATTDKEMYTEYYEHDVNYVTTDGKRYVGAETVIPSLYRFWKEYFSVEICKQGESEDKVKRLDLTTEKYNNTEAANQAIAKFINDNNSLIKGGKFIESFSRIRTSGTESTDTETGDSLVRTHGSVKTIIRYTRVN